MGSAAELKFIASVGLTVGWLHHTEVVHVLECGLPYGDLMLYRTHC